MTVAPLQYHVGILVFDLEAARARIGAAVGVAFGPAIATRTEDGSPGPRIAYSVEGPPYLELVEATGEALYAPGLGEGVHHVGFSFGDVPGWCGRLEEHGVRTEVVLREEDGVAACVFSDPAALHGVRVELVAQTRRAAFEARLGLPVTP